MWLRKIISRDIIRFNAAKLWFKAVTFDCETHIPATAKTSKIGRSA
jgi:hypothetical protein